MGTLLCVAVAVSCLPGPDPNAYYFSKTVWVNDTDKGNASSSEPDRGDFGKSVDNQRDIIKLVINAVDNQRDIIKLVINAVDDQETKLKAQGIKLRAQETKLIALEKAVYNQETSLTELEETVDFDDTILTDLISNSDAVSKDISSLNDSLSFLSTIVNDQNKVTHDQLHSVIAKTASNSKTIDNISNELRTSLDEIRGKEFSQQWTIEDNSQRLDSLSTRGTWCASRYRWKTTGTIPFEKHTLLDSNMDINGRPLDIDTGVFTAPNVGVYLITFSYLAFNDPGEQTDVYIYKNSARLEELIHNTGYGSGGSGTVRSTSGRSIYQRLEAGDTISLHAGHLSGKNIYRILFCIQFINN